jgi:hypothetical protein
MAEEDNRSDLSNKSSECQPTPGKNLTLHCTLNVSVYHCASTRPFGLSQLGLSRLISFHITLFILPVEHCSSSQTNKLYVSGEKTDFWVMVVDG